MSARATALLVGTLVLAAVNISVIVATVAIFLHFVVKYW